MSEPIPVVVVTRNNRHLTAAAVRSILAQDVPVSLLLVDNASTDNTARWAAARGFTSILYPHQVALAQCWNDALRALWKAGRDRAIVCNNDIELRSDTARVLNAHGGDFVTGVSVDSREEMGRPMEAGMFTERNIARTERPHPDMSCFLIRKSVTDRVGWFDESYYPAYCEDMDYHVRMHRAGIRAVSISVPFLHQRSSTLKQADAAERSRIQRGAERNRAKFKQKYGCSPDSPEYAALFAG